MATRHWRQLLTDLGIGEGSGGPDLTDPGTRTQGPRSYRRRGERTRARDGTEKRDAWQLPPSSEGGCCCGGERGARLGADSGEEAYGEPGASILPSCVGAARGRGAGAVAEAEEEADAGNSS